MKFFTYTSFSLFKKKNVFTTQHSTSIIASKLFSYNIITIINLHSIRPSFAGNLHQPGYPSSEKEKSTVNCKGAIPRGRTEEPGFPSTLPFHHRTQSSFFSSTFRPHFTTTRQDFPEVTADNSNGNRRSNLANCSLKGFWC